MTARGGRVGKMSEGLHKLCSLPGLSAEGVSAEMSLVAETLGKHE